MDGVLGLSFNGIGFGEIYYYYFELKQLGIYWYYSYLMFQEQVGLYGVLIIDLVELVLYWYDCEYVIMLLDWIDMDLGVLFWCMKKFVEYDNYYKCILFDFLCDVKCDGWLVVLFDCGMWGWMWMMFIDIFDINVYIYIYLMNGIVLVGNWIGLFCSGEKVLLCFINGVLMIYFDVCIFGLKMIVVVVDGQYIYLVSIDEFCIVLVEIYDVLVELIGQDVFIIFCQDMGCIGFVVGMLVVCYGLQVLIFVCDLCLLLMMSDMGYDMGSGDYGGYDMVVMKGMEGGCGVSMGYGLYGGGDIVSRVLKYLVSECNNLLVDMQSLVIELKLDDFGIGLCDNGCQVFIYGVMCSLFEDFDGCELSCEIELYLIGYMEKFFWLFDGILFVSVELL